MTKYILCYGDSNTRGTCPETGARFEYDERWPGVMAKALGNGYHIYENGLGGRTTVFDDPVEPDRNGKTVLPAILKMSAPLDLIVLMLGTNDCKRRFNVPAWDIGFGLEALLTIMDNAEYGRDGKPPRVLAVSPAHVIYTPDTRFGYMFDESSAKTSIELAPVFKAIAASKNAYFFDAASCSSVGCDGLHLPPEAHASLGHALAEKVREILV